MSKPTKQFHNNIGVLGVEANNTLGANGQVLYSNGSISYWGDIAGAGFTGSRGSTGFTGSQGYSGSQGPQGSTGFTGSQGIQGVIGFTGSQGIQGTTGFTGSQGIQGVIGYTGSQGIQGTTGFTGSQGIQGVIGFTGSQGIQGTTGFTGSQGTQGVIGFTGSQGPIGYTGSQGVIGYTGSQGNKGGIRFYFDSTTTAGVGSNGSLRFNSATIGSVTSVFVNINDVNGTSFASWLAAMSNSTNPRKGYLVVTNNLNGSSVQSVFAVTAATNNTTYYTLTVSYISGVIPANNDPLVVEFNQAGDLGFTGSQGVIGFTGSQGIQGTTGFTGSQGIQGVIGYTGSQGPQGVIGYTGSQGTQGVIGYTGSQGTQGVIGYTGSASTFTAGNGLVANATHMAVNANTGIIANSTGTFVNWGSPGSIGSTVANTGIFTVLGVGTTPSTALLEVNTGVATLATKILGPANVYQDLTDGTGTLRLQMLSNSPFITSIGAYPIVFGTNNTERMRIDANGNMALGGATLAYVNFYNRKNITGGVQSYANFTGATVQSDVTTAAIGVYASLSTAASAFTVSTLYKFFAEQGALGAGSSITTQNGFTTSPLTNATTNRGFYAADSSAITAGKTSYAFYTNQNVASGGGTTWGYYGAGTAWNYLNGRLGLGSTSLTGTSFHNALPLTGASSAYANYTLPVIQSDVTNSAYGYTVALNTAAAAFTITNIRLYYAGQGNIGAGSTVTNQYGFQADTLTGATTNYGVYVGNSAAITAGKTNYAFYTNQSVATGGGTTWGYYGQGTAWNYMNGRLGLGTTNLSSISLKNSLSITGSTSSYATYSDGVVQPDVTSGAEYYHSQAKTASNGGTPYTIGAIRHYVTAQSTFNVDSTVNLQYGFLGLGSLIDATNNYAFYADNTAAVTAGKTAYGFYSSINTATGGGTTWGLYIAGTALNYINGRILLGTAADAQANFYNAKAITGATTAYANFTNATVQSDVTSAAYGHRINLATQAAAFTLSSLAGMFIHQGTFGAGSAVNKQYGYRASGTLIGATKNYSFYAEDTSAVTTGKTSYGYYSEVAAATGGGTTWGFYAAGTAQNYFNNLSLALGAAATPSLNFLGDTNTGLWSPTADTIAVSTGGVERLRIDSAGNVGIGTTSMNGRLNVVASGGNSRITLGDNVAGTYPTLMMLGGARYNFQMGVNYNYNDIFEITPSTAIGGTTFSSPAFMISASTGNVGVGTTPGSLRLTVNGTPGATYYDLLRLETAGAGPVNITFSDSGTSTAPPTIGGTGNELVFGTGVAERMRIDVNGNVGIGTTAPSSLLEVRKDQNADTISKITNSNTGASAAARLDLATGTANSYLILALKDNAASPYGLLSVGSGVTQINYDSAIHLFRNLSGTERFKIDSSGLVTGRIVPRVGTVADAATITPTGDAADQYTVTALAQAATIAAPSGTPVNGQKLMLRIKDNGVARALTWTTSAGGYRVIGTTLPTTTVASKTTYVGCIYNSADSYWDVIAVTTQA